MLIAIDLDSTINRLGEKWLAWIKERDPAFSLEKWTSWSVHEHTSIGEEAYKFLSIEGIFRTLDVYEEAQRVIDRMQQKHEVLIVTAYVPESVVDKAAWVNAFFPKLTHDRMAFLTQKKFIYANADVVIDDGLHNFEGIGPKTKGIVFDQPWNRRASCSLYRAEGWNSIEKLLTSWNYF